MALDNLEVKNAIEKFKGKCEKAMDYLKSEFNNIRAGRANPHILDKISVNYYGTMSPINQVGNIAVPEPRMITIAPWDSSLIKEIEKAIIKSNIGLTPSNDGKVIRLVFPVLTEERRKEIIKQIKKQGEDSKVVIRNERRDIIEILKKFKKDNILTEDELATLEKDIDKEGAKFVSAIDQLVKDKEVDIMKV